MGVAHTMLIVKEKTNTNYKEETNGFQKLLF